MRHASRYFVFPLIYILIGAKSKSESWTITIDPPLVQTIKVTKKDSAIVLYQLHEETVVNRFMTQIELIYSKKVGHLPVIQVLESSREQCEN
jgi:hypothetical protein